MADYYQVIARRWRPQNFDEVVGQDHIVRTLKNAITQSRIAHAYLFVGPRGTGKTSLARIFAKALNCENGPSVAPNVDSAICQAIMNGACMDVVEIDGASNNSVDQIRELRDDCQYAPTQCRFKIYIIDEVHMLSSAAFNALLKTLEEPPAHVKFIFATTEAHKVLPTIISRCQRFEFKPIAEAVITEKLTHIAKTESLDVEPPALVAISRMAQGGMRDAQSALEQMTAFCGDKITEQDVLDVYGLAAPAEVLRLAQALGQANYTEILACVHHLSTHGRDLYRVLIDLQAIVRESLLDAIAHQGISSHLGHPLTTEAHLRILDALHAGEGMVQRGLSEALDFEIALLKAAEQSRVRAIDTVIQALSKTHSAQTEAGEKKNQLIEIEALHYRKLSAEPILVPIPLEIGLATCEATGPDVIEFPKASITQEEEAVWALSMQDDLGLAAADESGISIPLSAPLEAPATSPSIALAEAIAMIPPDFQAFLEERFRIHFTHVRRA